MDELGLAVLRAEMAADAGVFRDAAETASQRLRGAAPSALEACAYHIARAYNALERMALRVARAFENQIDDAGGWHAELLHRMSLDVPGVRPPLFPTQALADLAELQGFRHVVHHAYDLALRPDRVAAVLEAARRTAAEVPGWVDEFVRAVASREGWEPPAR